MAQPAQELDADRYIEVISENSALLAEAARRGLQPPVPTCPGWYVATLVAHIGEVQRFWAYIIRTRAQEPQDLPAAEYEECPGLLPWYGAAMKGETDLQSIPDGLIEWFEGGTSRLVDAFRGFKPEDRAWHWSGDNGPITHMRNQAMEATVHRWDAQNAHSATTPIDRDVAVDGIDQHFRVQIPVARKWGKPVEGQGETYHVHCTDGGEGWLLRFSGDAVSVSQGHGDADITIRGSAQDLFLWLWGRGTADSLDVEGDRSLLDRYRKLVPSSE